jgi:hypothetical protein
VSVPNLLSASYKQYLAGVFLTDNMKVVLLSAAYVYSAAHANLSDLSGIVATSGNLAGKSSTGGLLKANNVTFTALSGAAVTQFWLYRNTGVAGTSTLAIYFDQALGLVFTPNGTDAVLEWSPAGIAQL